MHTPRPYPLLPHGLILAIMGSEPRQRVLIGRFSRSVSFFVVCSLVLAVASAQQLVPTQAVIVVVAYLWLGSGSIFALLRSPFVQRWSDHAIAFVQLMFGISAITLAYILIDESHGAALQILCLLLVFEMDSLPSRSLLRASLYATGMLIATVLVREWLAPESQNLGREMYNLAMSSVLLPCAVMVGSEIRRLLARESLQGKELADTLDQLHELSRHDHLTGLTNRRQMMALLEMEKKRWHRTKQAFYIAIIDIDLFKHINDTFGHNVGDQVLQAFARLANQALTTGDTLSRWGGEEFLLLMPTNDQTQALHSVERIRERLTEFHWSQFGTGLGLTISTGITALDPEESITQALARADVALYRAKNGGRNRVVLLLKDAPLSSDPSHSAWPRQAASVSPATAAAFEHGPHPSPSLAGPDPPPSAASQSVDMAAAAPTTRMGDLFFGADPSTRHLLRLCLIGSANYFFWTVAIYFYAIPMGLAKLPLAYILMGIDSVGALTYFVVRSGCTARLKDPALITEQILFACFSCAVCYAAVPDLRPSVLHAMCVIQIFGMVNLSPKASRLTGLVAITTLIVGLGLLVSDPPPHFNTKLETLKIFLACFILMRLSMESYRYSKLREKLALEREAIAQAVTQVQALVVRDALTGLFNRRYMQELLVQECARAQRTGAQFCIALIDLDHFKHVNDTYGHQVGDNVLVGFSQTALSTFRETDVLSRWGGEEFLVMLRDTDPALYGLSALARLRERLRQIHPTIFGSEIMVTFSCGLTAVHPHESLRVILDRVDRHLYEAKHRGRDQCVTATADAPPQRLECAASAG